MVVSMMCMLSSAQKQYMNIEPSSCWNIEFVDDGIYFDYTDI